MVGKIIRSLPFFSLRWEIVLLLVFCCVSNTFTQAFASELFSDLSIQTHDDKSLLLFPYHEFNEIFVSRPGPEIIILDLPNFILKNSPKFLVNPHPFIRFVRLSQVNNNPDIVRAIFFFLNAVRLEPIVKNGHLFLEGDFRAIEVASRETSLVSSRDGANVKSGAIQDLLDQRVTLEFTREDLATILNALAMKFDLRIFADSGVKGKFTINAQNIALREVLKSLLLERNFQYTLKGKNLTIISLEQGSGRIAKELMFKELNLKDALQTISKMVNVNLIIHESVPNKLVNFYVENLNLDELLDLMIKTNELEKIPYNDNTFVIMGKKEAKDYSSKQYKAFKLINARPAEVIKIISESKSLASKVDINNIAINDRINALSVYDTPENIELLSKVISSVDEKLKQAVIELKLIEINRSNLKQLGISLDPYSLRLNDVTRLPTSHPLPATLDFLERQNKIKVLASPKIRVVHGKKASINIGEVIPVPYFRYENATGSYLVFKEYRDIPVGINLEVLPEITRDNEISLELNTSVNSVIEINSDGQIHKSERRTNTYVRIKDGETVVLGGLISQKDSVKKQSPSVLNKVPLLRSLLGKSEADLQSSEMIMLVTPHLVNLDTLTSNNVSQSLLVEQGESL